jgi:signal transduction histidine kinase
VRSTYRRDMPRMLPRLPVLDVLLGGSLAVAAAIDQATYHDLPQPWVSIVAAIWTGSVILRTVAPFAMVVVASLGAVVYVAFPVSATLLTTFVALLVIGFSMGANLDGRRLWLALAMLLSSTYVVQIVTAQRPGGDTGFADVYLSPIVLMAPVLGGVLLRRSRHQTAELRRLAAELAAERQAHLRAAAAEERNRIARELHDVISHSVSVMVVQAGAAEQQLPAESPAREQLLAVRRTGKEALTELRRQLGVLRGGPDQSPAPLPRLADVTALADQPGVTLEYDEVAIGDIPAGLALAAYRIVQECLTNARKHASGAAVHVRVGRDPDGLAVDVTNGPGGVLLEPSTGGHGLTGMRERAQMYAGHLDAGHTEEGGWTVRARLPTTPPATGLTT